MVLTRACCAQLHLQRQLASGPVVSGPKVRWGVTGLDAKGRFIWLAIFPLVAIGLTATAPFTVGWDPGAPSKGPTRCR